MKKFTLLGLLFSLLACGPEAKKQTPPEAELRLPNIIIFYVDDLGYGDLSSYGATGVETPNVDRLAHQGIRFTDAHSSAATCTPSRYSLLTGQYAFRNHAQILPGDAPLLIRPETPTLPRMLKQAGYKTAVVGKWHLGLGDGDIDWNGSIRPGPLDIGFDYSFLLPATGDRVPTVYLENEHVVGLVSGDSLKISYKTPFEGEPTGITHPNLLRQQADSQHSQAIVNGISRIGYQTGGESALWTDEDFHEVFTSKAQTFIRDNRHEPFFLFFSFHDIHVPRLPHPRFQGRSAMGPRGDAIVQMDWITGAVMEELRLLGIEENTLVLFTSDNGPVLNDGYEDQSVELLGEHRPAGPFRGGKYSAYEAGTRVPLIAYWPDRIPKGQSDALVSQIDFYASLARLTGIALEKGVAKDSQDVLKALLNAAEPGRDVLLEEAFTLSLRHGSYKYIVPVKNPEAPEWLINKNIEAGFSDQPQLFDLKGDPGETENIAPQNKAMVRQMQAMVDSIKAMK